MDPELDIKGQVNRGNANLDDWDQRKSQGEFKGSPEGMHVATVVEFRASGDLADLLINPARLSEYIRPGDNALMVINRILNDVTNHQPNAFGLAASLARLGGDGPVRFNFFAYDKD